MATIPTPCYKYDMHEEEFSCQHNEEIESTAAEYTTEVDLLELLEEELNRDVEDLHFFV